MRVTWPVALWALVVAAGAAPVGVSAPTGPEVVQRPLDIVMRYRYLGNIERTGFREPSGLCYHPTRRALFLVGDEGDIAEMTPAGKIRRQKLLFGRKRDLEGVTVDPATGRLYVAIESWDGIVEVDPDKLTVLRRFKIERTHNGKTVLAEGGNGVEGIAFVPDAAHPEGGTFLVTNQVFNLDNTEDPSAVVRVELPLKSKPGQDAPGKIVGVWRVPVIDLSALHYDAQRKVLFVGADAPNVLLAMDLTGRVLRTWALPEDQQEGIALDDDGHLYIASDGGGVTKLKWTPPLGPAK
jgi:hypothetical protein